MFDNLNAYLTAAPWWLQLAAAAAMAVPAGAGMTLAVVFAAWCRRTVRALRAARSSWPVAQVLIWVGVVVAGGIAGIGGYRSFDAVSQRFDDHLVPLTADGMILACTALRLAALARGWRLPGIMLATYGFIGGTVVLNVSAANDVSDVIAHALAPVSFALLQEYLAHLLRLHLRLSQPSRPKVTALTWFTSPVVTTRVWLHLARTGGDDPVSGRALVQQLIRMASRLRAVCPSGRWPLDAARAARIAALQTIRDGLLPAVDLAALLPAGDERLTAAELLALVDGAALTRTAGAPLDRTGGAPVQRTDPAPQARTGAPEPVRTDRTAPVGGDPAPHAPATAAPDPALVEHRVGRDERTDHELVAELLAHAAASGGPLSQREVMRLLGCGTPKAKRLVELAGWPTAGGGAARPGGAGAAAARPEARGDHPQLQIVPINTTDEPETGPQEANDQAQDTELDARTTQ